MGHGMYQPNPYQVFLQWLLLSTVSLALLFLLWDQQVLQYLLFSDVTRITSLTLLVYGLSCMHCGWRSLFLAREYVALDRLKAGNCVTSGLVQGYLANLGPGIAENAVAAEVLGEHSRGQHQVGWFVTGVVIKLGLLGTVIGFVLMLGSVSELDNLDISDIKALMQQMTSGMGVAMNTTLMALVCSILMGLQYLLLDRSADRLVVESIELGQRRYRAAGLSGAAD
jgi:hypothetical protein